MKIERTKLAERSDYESCCPNCGHPTEVAYEEENGDVFWECEKCGHVLAQCFHERTRIVGGVTEDAWSVYCRDCGTLVSED